MNQFTTDLLDLRLCDNMELMAQYPDKHFDLAIVDPPYGIKINMNQGRRKNDVKKHAKKTWDNAAPSDLFFQELFRVSKNQIIWGANNFVLPPSNGWIVWDKDISGDVDFSKAELAYSNLRNSIEMVKIRAQTGAEVYANKIHPTQKPVALYKWLLHNYAKQGDNILDTHLGSMSIAIACHDYGFHLTGCELDPDYFAAGVQRVQSHIKQLTLF